MEKDNWLEEAGISQKDLTEVFDFMEKWKKITDSGKTVLLVKKKRLEWPEGDIILVD